MRLIEQLVVLITIIPATQFFRSSITGLGGGLTDSLSSNALSMGAGVAMGAVSGFMSNKFNKSNGKMNAQAQSSGLSDLNFKNVKQAQTSGVSEMRGSIPNADMGKFSGSKLNSAVDVGRKVGKPIMSAGKVAGAIGKATIGTGISMGGVAIGNKGLTGAGAFAVVSSASDLSDSISAKTGKISDVLKDKYSDSNADDNGFKYMQDLGDMDAYKYNTEMLRDSTGIADMSDSNFGNKKGVAVTLDGTMRDENSDFVTENKNLSSQTNEIGNMVRAFKNNDTEAINAYKNQGIENCAIKDGKVMVGYNSSNSLGILGASKEANGKNTIVTKNKLANQSMEIRIPKITEGYTYENSKKREPDIFADIQ